MKRAASLLVILLLVGLVDTAGVVAAPPLPAVDTPASLEPWQSWVLHDKAERRCPVHFDDGALQRCWWPSRLAVDAGGQGGLFDQQVTVYAPTWVTLPGDETHWPESVAIGTTVVPVVGRDGRPCIWLEPGDHRIGGAFLWDGLPETLQIPAATGILSLTVDGRAILEPDLDPAGRLRLLGSGRAARREDTLAVTVFRLIEDDIPMRVTTRILLQVSGRPRELRLADLLLPAGAVVMKIDSPLPTRLADQDDLLIQARPGRWDIRVTVRLHGPVQRLSAGKTLYGEEIWSFKAFNHLRMVNVLGAPTLEPSRTRMPDDWQGFPAYLLKAGGALSFDVIRRGDPDPAPDQLSLQRTWWLDFDGGGFTIHDRIGGRLSRTWHLAMAEPFQLGRLAVDGRDQLITLQGDSPSPGVQLRRGRLALEADSRLPRASSSLPAIGWDHDFQQVRAELRLPPGWTLMAVAGVDDPPGAWLQQWTLLDIFLVLIIAVTTYKIRNRATALLALATLVLIFHEAGAPRQVWLHLLAVAALLKYLPDGWFKKLVRLWGAVAAVALVVIALPFMAQQVRSAIFPQLADGGIGIGLGPPGPGADMLFEAQKSTAPAPAAVADRSRQAAERVQTMQKPPEARPARFLPDPDALIQTGPGLPAWQWRSEPLRWTGPVEHTQQIRLWLISPAINLILGLARVLLLALLIMAFLDLRNWRKHLPAALKTALLALMLLVLLTPVQSARAETGGEAFPPQPLLDELQRRLLAPPHCLPHCADVSRLELSATPDQLRLIMQAHAQVTTAIPLPVTQDTWRPNQLMLDNEPVNSLARDDRGNLWMVLPQGVHRIKMTGPAGSTDEIRMAFPIVPHIGTYAGVGWQALGFRPDGGMDATVSLTRLQPDTEAADLRRADIPAFFQVTRTLHLGIQWEATTHVRRLTAPGEPVVLSIPLLKDASLTTAGIQVTDGMARIALGPEETEVRFSTNLPIRPTIQLTAPQDVPWTETWILDAVAIWRCTPAGLPVVHHQDAEHNWQPQWRPWPGEQVTIAVSRPEAVAGRTITTDSARLTLTPGQRVVRADLTLTIRSSKGGQHQIELPALANLQTLTINGKSLPIRQDGQLITLPLEPGMQSVGVQWLQLSDAMSDVVSLVKAPRVNLGDAAVNAAITFHMPAHRWILFTGGPRLGPAVLFWSYAIVVLLVALGLGKTDIAPLRTRQWLLLGLGLTQVPAAVAVIVVGWLLALGYRCRKEPPTSALAFDLMQVLLVFITVAALAGLYSAIERGLLGIPDMQIAGNQSTRIQLNWFQDRIDGTLPIPWVVSLPLWSYHLLMLAWSLWLAFSLVAWLRWGWACFAKAGLWKHIAWRRRFKPDRTAAIES